MRIEHPAPWRWIDVGGVQLVSADHVEWTDEDDGRDDVLLSDRILCIPREMSPYVREVVRVSPEMEVLLREVRATFDSPVINIVEANQWTKKVVALLAGIDAAKAGT